MEVVMRTIICLLVLTLSVIVPAAESQIDKRLRDCVTALGAAGEPGATAPVVDGAVKAMLEGGALEGRPGDAIRAFGELIELMGRPDGLVEVAVRRYGRAEIAYFVVTCAKGVGYVRVESLKRADNSKMVSGLLIKPGPDGVFPPGLLEPETIQSR
jgi:hypothetical protein